MRHFSELTKDEVANMSYQCEMAAVRYAKKIGMSGLSSGNEHNIYRAIQDALNGEWEQSKKVRKEAIEEIKMEQHEYPYTWHFL